MLLLALAVSARVLVGVADVDGTATVVGAAGGAHLSPICTVEHRRGFLPKGTVVGHRAVFALSREGARDEAGGADIVVVDLKTCGQQTLARGAIALQAPVVVDGSVVFVRERDARPEGARFEIVAVSVDGGPERLLTSREALWITPARGAQKLSSLRFLVGEGKDSPAGARDGAFHVDKIENGDLVVDVDLAALFPESVAVSAWRAPVLVSNALLVEKGDGKRGALVDGEGKTIWQGLAGLSPVTDGVHVAFGDGSKGGGVVVDGIKRAGARAGVARPQLLSQGTVVVWLDRGASLPGELWSIPPTDPAAATKKKPELLLPPAPKTAVEVYGVIE